MQGGFDVVKTLNAYLRYYILFHNPSVSITYPTKLLRGPMTIERRTILSVVTKGGC